MNADPVAPGFERKFANLVVDRIEANGTFAGYASVFGMVDLGKDVVEPGAFAKSLRRRAGDTGASEGASTH